MYMFMYGFLGEVWKQILIQVPKLIDYMSLDVEGAEYEILKNFPFDKFKFKSMSIERPNKNLDLFHTKNIIKQWFGSQKIPSNNQFEKAL